MPMLLLGDATDAAPQEGLSDREAAERLAREGPNELPSARPRSTAAIAADVLREPMLLLLVATGLLYLLIGELQESLALLAAIFVVIGITLFQERKTERTLFALRDLSSPRALVVRQGRVQRIAGRDLVRGDLLVLEAGDRIAADGAVLGSSGLRVDESLLTGESVPVTKTAAGQPASRDGEATSVHSGTLVVAGHGLARVTATGAATELGRIGRTIAGLEIGRTRLQKEVTWAVRVLAFFGLSACLLLAALYGIGRGQWLEGALAGLTLAISMVPEEFPVILTVFLALGAWRISRSHVLTRRFVAIETLGAATVLCVDKTGTLTLNQMRISAVSTADGIDRLDMNAGPGVGARAVLRVAMLAAHRYAVDPIDRALADHGWRDTLAAGSDAWSLVREYPLTDSQPVTGNVWSASDQQPRMVAIKGAPETVIALCGMSGADADRTLGQVEQMAREGLRVLGVAQAAATGELPPSLPGFRFDFVGLVGLADPVRPGVPDAIRECHSAGIRVVMLTGDYPATARSIARQIGLRANDGCLSGPELVGMDDAAIRRAIGSVDVFARIKPDQKLRLVRALQANGDVVAMTGDGVNDAPALKAADIGVAMGSRGTDVAREAAALVLLDDDFTSIVRAVRLGRRIYDNIRKAVGYVLAIHVPIAGITLVPSLLGWPLVLMPLHVIFMEMIIDPACSVAFEMEPEEGDVMRRRPRDPRTRLFSPRLVLRSLLQGSGMWLIALAVYIGARQAGLDDRDTRTVTFTTLIISNLMLILTNRSLTRSLVLDRRSANPALGWIVATAVIALCVVLFVPAARDLFVLARPHALDLAVCAAAGLMAITWMELLKVLTRDQVLDGALPS